MHIHSFRHLTTVAALALTSIAAAAACSSTAVQARPGQAPSTASPSASTRSTATPSSATPSTGAPRAPNPAGLRSCLGAVRYTIDASEVGPPWSELCIAVGGVLRVENLGPDGFSVIPADKVSCWYEAGVRECRLIRTGTVRFTITYSQAPRPLTVVVAEPSSPPGPSTACTGARTYTVDASEGGPSWPAMCVKVGAVLRVENLGPDGFSVSPVDKVSCWYEAGVRECRFVRSGTVTFTITHGEAEARYLTVVVIK
jgi:hypothetical protein